MHTRKAYATRETPRRVAAKYRDVPEAEILPFGHIYQLTYHSLSGLAAHQSRDMDSPARSGAYPASLWDTNSVKSRTRLVLRVSRCVRSQSVPYICRLVPGTLASRGSASPMKQGSVVIPSPCRTATICASASVVRKGTPAVRTSPSLAQSGIPCMLMTIHRMGSGAPARHAAS